MLYNCISFEVSLEKQLKVRFNRLIVIVDDGRELVVNQHDHRYMQNIVLERYASDSKANHQCFQIWVLGQLYWDPLRVQWCERSILVIYQRKHYYYVFCFAFQCLPFMKWIATQSNVNHIFSMNV
jgi:hypothetical protein